MKNLIALALIFSLTACGIIPEKDASTRRKEELNSALSGMNVPDIQKTLLQQGDDALAAGDSLKAEYYYNQLTKQDPKNDLYKYKYADALRRRGSCKPALDLYDDVLKDKPTDIDAQEGKALCLVADGEFQQASPLLTDIIHRDQTRWKSINAAGLVFAANKKYKEANQYLDLAADVSKHNPSVLNNQALVKALVGNNDDATKILKEAEMKSGDGTGQQREIGLNLALVYAISRNLDAAQAAATPYLTKPQLFNNMGIYAELAKDPDLARTYLNKALMGTSVYYDRAWDNLDKLGNNGATAAGAAKGKRR